MAKIKKKVTRGKVEYLKLSGVKKTDLIKDLERKYKGELRQFTNKGRTIYYIRRKKR